MDDDLIGTAEAAAILGLSRHALTSGARRGSIPHVGHGNGPGRRYLFRRSEILALAAEQAAMRQETLDERTRTGKRLVGTAEAATILGVSPTTVVNWANRGRFPAHRYAAGGTTTLWRFARADVLAFAERRASAD